MVLTASRLSGVACSRHGLLRQSLFGLFDIQVKSGLLILPICVMMHGRLSAQDWNVFVRAFLAGLLLAFVACSFLQSVPGVPPGRCMDFFIRISVGFCILRISPGMPTRPSCYSG